MKALIKDNKVYDVVENEFPVTNEFIWVNCENTVKQGFSYDGSTFISNEITDEEKQARLAKQEAKANARASALAKLTALGLTEEEVNSII
jgi:hypothetical protein